MNAYNELDGIPCAADCALLTELLRGEWGFDGCVVADYFSIRQLADYHRLAADARGRGCDGPQCGARRRAARHRLLRRSRSRDALAGRPRRRRDARQAVAPRVAVEVRARPLRACRTSTRTHARASGGATAERDLASGSRARASCCSPTTAPCRSSSELRSRGGDRPQRRRRSQPLRRLHLPRARRVAARDDCVSGQQPVSRTSPPPGRATIRRRRPSTLPRVLEALHEHGSGIDVRFARGCDGQRRLPGRLRRGRRGRERRGRGHHGDGRQGRAHRGLARAARAAIGPRSTCPGCRRTSCVRGRNRDAGRARPRRRAGPMRSAALHAQCAAVLLAWFPGEEGAGSDRRHADR